MSADRDAATVPRRTPLVSVRSAGWLSVAVVFVIGLLRLAGGLLHVTLLTSVAPSWIEMKAITMVCFLVSAVALTLIYLRPAGSRRSIGAAFLGGLVGLVGLVTVADYVSHLTAGTAPALSEAPFLNLLFSAHARMALTTAFVFLLVGLAIVLLASGTRRPANVAHALGFPAAIVSYMVPVSYLLGVQSMSSVLGTAMALNTGIAFCFLCLAVFCARTDTWLMRAFTGDEVGAFMARRLLPALMATPLVVGWFRLQGERTGLFNSEVGVALVVIAYTAVFVVLVWLAAQAANRSDALRSAAERAVRENAERLRQANSLLEAVTTGTEVIVAAVDTNFRYLFFNRAYREEIERLGGRGLEVGASIKDVFAHMPELQESAIQNWSRTLKGDVRGTYRLEFGDPGRYRRTYSVRQTLIRDAKGAIAAAGEVASDITEQVKAEEALRRNEATLRGILDAARESIWLFSADGVVLQANAMALTRFGKTGPEVVGKSMEEILSPELARSRRARLQEVVESARPVEFEDERAGMQFRHSFYPVTDTEGRVVSVASYSRDITESKRAEKALHRSRERQEILAGTAASLLATGEPQNLVENLCRRVMGHLDCQIFVNFLVDEPSHRLRLNACAGVPPKKVKLIEWLDFGQAVCGAVAESGKPIAVDHIQSVPDPRATLVKSLGADAYCCHPLLSQGKVIGTLSFGTTTRPAFSDDDRAMMKAVSDLVAVAMERVRNEEALRESEERLRKLYSAMSEGMALHHLVYDDSGKAVDYRIVDVNPAFEAITGLSRANAVGRLASELYGTGSPPYIDIYAKVAETAEPAEFETEFAPMAKCFHISVFSPGKGIFATVFSDITARKQTERRLAEQAAMLASANDAIVGYDAGYRVTFWNRSAELMYGYGEADALGKVSTELFHPVYVGVTREEMVERIAADGHVETESIRTTRDGRQLSVEAHVIALRNEQGVTTGFVSVDRDITERKRAEEALREAKENLEVRVRERTAELAAEVEERKRAEERLAATSQYVRSLIESSLDPLVTINAEGRITDVNEATVNVTGATCVELIGTDFCEYFTEPEKAREGYRRVFAKGFVTDYPLTVHHRDGHLTDVLYNASVYKDTRGNIVGAFAAARDVTDTKRAEAAVAEERQRFRDVLNMLPAYVILLAPDYTVPFANRFFEERFGKSLGRRCYDYLFHRAEPCENCETFTVMKTNGPHHWEWLGPDGRNYDISDFPFRDVDGSPLILEVGIDITERKRAEQALKKAHDTLEVKVEERTAELKRSNEELEQFAYVASHDLQEPLRMVASYVELLGQRYKGRLDEKADKYIAYASGGAIRMHQLVNDLLAFSRVGTWGVSFAPVNLDRVVEQARQNLTVAIEKSGAVVNVDRLPAVSGDESQLVQLFQNLFDNAVKFHGAEPPRIYVTADAAAERHGDAEMVTISVADNGIGIDPKQHDRIFRLFQRLHTQEEYPGTGIGLAVCKKIVERHGGAIRVESAEGGGSVFRFTLPKLPMAEPAAPGQASNKE